MAVTAFSITSNVPITLQGAAQAAVIALRLPHTGTFVVWGKVVISNDSPAPLQSATVFMTTLDGVTTLDNAVLGLASGGQVSVSLQSTLDLSQPSTNEIVDIRCSTAQGHVTTASLIAIPVDALSGPVPPGT
jgi:hypothetical protein